MTEGQHRRRIALIRLGLIAFWCLLGYRLFQLHMGPNEDLRRRVAKIRTVEKKILVGRGRILDASGNVLALDLPTYHVCVDPQRISEKGHAQFVGYRLARLLELPAGVIFDRIARPGRRFEYIKQFVPDDTARQIHKMQLTGVFFEDATQRHYPKNALMCHVLGFSNMEGVGSAGVELRMDSLLKGREGLRITERDGRKREVYMRRSLEIAPQEGADVYLTLDQNLQYRLECALDAAVETHHARGAWGIVQRVRTGEILAMASRPAFDLNAYRNATQEEMLNRCIGYTYEPGSTFKIAVIAAALNEGTVTPETVFDCENGRWFYKGKMLRDFHPYGRLTVADILKKSSNIGAAKIAMTLGPEKLERYLREFGVGSKTGIDLPGEEGGVLRPVREWSALSISRIPMGHEVTVTALQMLNVACTLANHGFRMKPGVVQRVVDARGNTVKTFAPEVVAHPIRDDTARLMCRLMARVTEEGGTGTRARVPGYVVAGKTGTAQKVLPTGGYSETANVSSFVGFLPADQPEIGIIIVVDEPQSPQRTGGYVAAPVFAEVASQAVRYLGVPPSETNGAAVAVVSDIGGF
jgi:cell division protein FtsI (penicillin-binding protein 3)